MAPEQWNPSGTIDHRSDIYSAGVILYEALTGKKPEADITPPSTLCSDVSPRLDSIVLKCLQRDPNDRYQSAVELKNDILSAVQDLAVDEARDGEATKRIGVSFVGKYTFLDTLQESQFGATYLVKNTENGSLRIIKKLCKNIGGIREAKLLSRLTHPHLIKVYGAGLDAKKGIIITEYLEGGSLLDRLIKPYPINTAARIFRQIASALSYAHKNGIVHGNMRPSNVLFDKSNNVKLTDFALPEHYLRNRDNWYAAPERRRSRSADIYATGIILYQLLTARLPDLRDKGELAWISKSADLRFALLNLVSQMLEQDSSRRPASFDSVLNILDKQQAAYNHMLSAREATIAAHS
jgi:serine/threonine protein kinase